MAMNQLDTLRTGAETPQASAPALQRSNSKIPHFSKFNDFCSGVDEDDVYDLPQSLRLPKFERSWSISSNESDSPRSMSARPSFSEKFHRALFEFMHVHAFSN